MRNASGKIGKGKAIAIIEDDGEMRSMLVDYFSAAGFEVHSFSGAEEFLQVAAPAEGTFSFVLADVYMNGSNGLKMLEAIRKSGSGLHVLLMTAAPSFKDELAAQCLGAQGYLRKPFPLSELLRRVRESSARIGA